MDSSVNSVTVLNEKNLKMNGCNGDGVLGNVTVSACVVDFVDEEVVIACHQILVESCASEGEDLCVAGCDVVEGEQVGPQGELQPQ